MGAAPQSGRVLDHYRLLEKLGEGGMGVVWMAEDTRLGRKVAVKFLPPEAARDTVRRQRFEQEARAAAVLSHPGIATVHELTEDEGQVFIVFEYVPGSTLRNYVVPGGLTREELLDIASDIAEALATAHTAGVVHRDLKPENVMRTPTGDCKVLDFGLARISPGVATDSAAETFSHLTTAGMVVGTPGYMAPEQLEGKEVDFRCDIFAFGTLLYELATGIHPFEGSSSASTIAAIMTADPLPLTQRNRLQPAELERIVRKCLRKRREERYQSTPDLAVDLANLKRESRESTTAVTVAGVSSEDDAASLFRGLRRLIPSMRRWWEVMLLFSMALYFAGAVLAWLVRGVSVVQSGWQNAWFLAVLLTTFTLGFLKMSVLLRAVVDPRTLPERVARFLPAIRLFTVLYGGLVLLAAPQLSVDRYPTAAPLAIVAGFALFIYGLMVEPMNNHAAFPQAFAAREEKREGGRRGWFWMHYLVTLFATTPLVIWLTWTARTYMPGSLRLPLFLLTSISIGLHWSARFAVVSAGFGDPQGLRAQMQRMRPWILGSGWPIVAGLAAIGLAIAKTNDALAAIIGAASMGGVACLLFLDPAVERAAFPGGLQPGAAKSRPKWLLVLRGPTDPAQKARRKYFHEIAMLQSIVTEVLATMLVVVSPVRLWVDVVASGHITWIAAYGAALALWSAALAVSMTFAVRSWKQERPAVERFLRCFWLYVAADSLWFPVFIWAAVRVPALLVMLPLPLAFGAMPFYQRQRARALLAEPPSDATSSASS